MVQGALPGRDGARGALLGRRVQQPLASSSGKGSWIHNPISPYDAALAKKMPIADDINHHSSPAGPAGIHSAPADQRASASGSSRRTPTLAKDFIRVPVPEGELRRLDRRRPTRSTIRRSGTSPTIRSGSQEPEVRDAAEGGRVRARARLARQAQRRRRGSQVNYVLPDMVAKAVNGMPDQAGDGLGPRIRSGSPCRASSRRPARPGGRLIRSRGHEQSDQPSAFPQVLRRRGSPARRRSSLDRAPAFAQKRELTFLSFNHFVPAVRRRAQAAGGGLRQAGRGHRARRHDRRPAAVRPSAPPRRTVAVRPRPDRHRRRRSRSSTSSS